MTATEIIRQLRQDTGTSLSELAEYSNLGTKSNISQMLSRSDLKVRAFVSMLEVMGYQLIVQNVETDEAFVIDYDL